VKGKFVPFTPDDAMAATSSWEAELRTWSVNAMHVAGAVCYGCSCCCRCSAGILNLAKSIIV